MKRWLGKYSEVFYVLMRMVVGFLFTCHGAQKLFGMFGGQRLSSDPLVVTAGVIEFIGGGLVALGLWAGYAAFVASGLMAVAYFMAHASGGFWPIVNKGEARGSILLRLSLYRIQGVGWPERRCADKEAALLIRRPAKPPAATTCGE